MARAPFWYTTAFTLKTCKYCCSTNTKTTKDTTCTFGVLTIHYAILIRITKTLFCTGVCSTITISLSTTIWTRSTWTTSWWSSSTASASSSLSFCYTYHNHEDKLEPNNFLHSDYIILERLFLTIIDNNIIENTNKKNRSLLIKLILFDILTSD